MLFAIRGLEAADVFVFCLIVSDEDGCIFKKIVRATTFDDLVALEIESKILEQCTFL